MLLRMCMELDTEFRYPNVIDFWGTTLYHLCQFTLLDLKFIPYASKGNGYHFI